MLYLPAFLSFNKKIGKLTLDLIKRLINNLNKNMKRILLWLQN